MNADVLKKSSFRQPVACIIIDKNKVNLYGHLKPFKNHRESWTSKYASVEKRLTTSYL